MLGTCPKCGEYDSLYCNDAEDMYYCERCDTYCYYGDLAHTIDYEEEIIDIDFEEE